MSNSQSVYTADKIKVLEGLDAVRKRPAMYIGSTGLDGLHHLVYEAVDNAVDEAMAGFCTKIRVVIHINNSISVSDNGRGIPVELHPTENIPAIQVVMTKLHAGGKFDSKAYKVAGGLHGVGISVVNALSSWMEVEVSRDNKIFFQRYIQGNPVTALSIIGKSYQTGTKVTFLPSSEIFETKEFSFDILTERIRELSFLNRGLEIILVDERTDKQNIFLYKGGISEFIDYISRNNVQLHQKPIYLIGEKDKIKLEIAMRYTNSFNERILSFANNINTREGGMHLTGFKAALTRTINNYIGINFSKIKIFPSGEDVREGLYGIISICLPEPQFEGQTKTKLGNSEVKGLVEQLVNEQLAIYLEENPSVARKIVEKVTEAARAREAAKKARDLVRKKIMLNEHLLPGKLADCSEHDPSKAEIFIVEGDSAGGSAKQARDRRFQAILPLKGKILNVEKARFYKVLENAEIRTIITALGAGIEDEDFSFENLRYHKIIVMTDADVDGSHIRTLLLTFFYRTMKNLIEEGYLYIAQPPLYRIIDNKKEFYVKDELLMNKLLLERACSTLNFLEIPATKQLFSGDSLLDYIKLANSYLIRLEHLKRRGYPIQVLLALLDLGIHSKSIFSDEKETKKTAQFLVDKGFIVNSIIFDEKDCLFKIVITCLSDSKKDAIISWDLINSVDYNSLTKFYHQLIGNHQGPFYLNKKEFCHKVSTIDELIKYLTEDGIKGLHFQRYKGLGEMNPKQLWETTMDPEKRTLLQVRIEDAMKADEIFITLMGNEVEPRREFIIQNALNVRVLDI